MRGRQISAHGDERQRGTVGRGVKKMGARRRRATEQSIQSPSFVGLQYFFRRFPRFLASSSPWAEICRPRKLGLFSYYVDIAWKTKDTSQLAARRFILCGKISPKMSQNAQPNAGLTSFIPAGMFFRRQILIPEG